jgi:hypothetical protein
MTKISASKETRVANSRHYHQHLCSFEELQEAVTQFSAWLEKGGYASYDPYDLWGTGYGRWARRLYYAKNPLGSAMTAPVILMEIVCPWLRALFVKKDRFPTADAQLVLSFLNLHELARGGEKDSLVLSGQTVDRGIQANDCQSQTRIAMPLRTNKMPPLTLSRKDSYGWLVKAKELAEQILDCSIPGYSGHCWGYPFDWENVNGLIRKNTPHITATPYCYEAFIRLFETTGQTNYLEVARSASAFVYKDLNDTPTGEDAAAGSYTPFDSGKVVNANAYRAFVLFDAARRFNFEHYRDKAWKNLRFILDSQKQDGSWLYAIDNPGEAFIDHFHTCFVLKNLYKLNRYLRNEEVKQAIWNGYRYYREALFDEDDNPKSFSIAPRMQIVRNEMYNFAEAINLCTLLGAESPEAFSLACKLSHRVLKQYRLRDGHFITRTYLGGFRHTLPFLRWPQAQMFHAITSLLVSLARMDETVTA